MNKDTVVKTFRKHREASKRGLSSQYEAIEEAWSFYNGDQMTYSDKIQFMDTFGRKRRAMVNFNKVQQNVDSVQGFMAQTRRQAKLVAYLNNSQSQQLYSKNMNALYDFHRENEMSDQIESEMDLDMLVGGVAGSDTEVSYIIGKSTMMPNGEILKCKLDPRCMYWNASANGINLLDSNFAGYWKDYPLGMALDLFQNSTKDDFEQVSDEDPSNTGYVFNPYGGIYDKIKLSNTVEWASQEEELVRVYNHQWYEYERFYRAENPIYSAPSVEHALYYRSRLEKIQTEITSQSYPEGINPRDIFDFDPAAETLTFNEQGKRLLVKEFADLITPVAFTRKVFYTAVISGDHVFTWFKSISQQGFSIKFKTGTYNRTKQVWVGMVAAMKEPAKYFNKALTELMFTIAANSKGGVLVEEDAVEDIADFETKWAKTDGVIKVASGALAAGKIQQKSQAALPTGLDGILQLAEANISQNGVDPAFLGDIGKEDQSGVLYKRRIRQVISKFARYFDSIELYQKQDARLHGDLIPIWMENNEGHWVRITGEDGADQFIQLTKDMWAPEYDVTIQEAPQSSEEKQETAIVLKQYSDTLFAAMDPQAGKGFMAESLQFMRLDGDVRNRLTQLLQPQNMPDPQQIQQMMAENEQLKALVQSGEVEKTKSETDLNRAKTAQMMENADYTRARTPLTNAQTVKTLEEANRTSVEAEVAAKTPIKETSVNL